MKERKLQDKTKMGKSRRGENKMKKVNGREASIEGVIEGEEETPSEEEEGRGRGKYDAGCELNKGGRKSDAET